MKAEAEKVISGRSRMTSSDEADGLKVVRHLQARARLFAACVKFEALRHSLTSPEPGGRGRGTPSGHGREGGQFSENQTIARSQRRT
jgi:hypothetical protein